MFPWTSRRARRGGRDRFRPGLGHELGLAAPESLETRALLAYSVLGQSLPDLIVSGWASTAAAWGGPITVTVNVRNIGASTIIEPLALPVGATSSADAPPSVVAVYAVRSPTSLAGAVRVGSVNVPAVPQNSTIQVTQSFNLPPQPLGFPGDGGKIYLVFVANATGTVFESDPTNDVSAPVPVFIQAPLPELAVVGLDVPPVMQPGDVIQPNIRIANFGPADTAAQGPLTVALVASPTPSLGVGSTVLALYTVGNVPGVQNVASKGPIFADANQTPQLNVVTIAGDPVTLPATPARYFLGVVIDPLNQIKQLKSVATFTAPANPFSLPQIVGPPIFLIPPAGQVTAGGAANVPVFPNPYGGKLVGGSLDGKTFPALFPPAAPGTTTGGGTTTPPPILSAGFPLFRVGRPVSPFGHGTPTRPSFGPTSNHLGINPIQGRRVALASRFGGASGTMQIG